MSRVMGLDIGEKRIGVALSDPLGITAQGFGVINAEEGKVLEELKTIAKNYDVKEIVVGLPLSLNGSIGPQAQKVIEIAQRISEVTGLPVFFWDERLSSKEAEKLLISADQSRKRRKEVKDKVSATIILQSYLESRRRECEGKDPY